MTGRRGAAGAAVLLTALTAVSQVFGLVRDAVIAAVFGAGAALDAYLVSQGLMNLILALVATSMARAVVPSVTRAARDGDVARAHRTVQAVLTTTFLVLVTGSVVMYAAADVVVQGIAPGFEEATADRAVSITRILLVATVFVAGTNILAAAAQAHGRFLFSGLEGIPFNLVMIAAAAWYGERYGVDALAWGFVVGSLARMLLQVPPLRAIRFRFRPRLGLRDEDFHEVLRLLPALIVTSAVVNVNTLVDRAVGSAQGEGVITALSFGWRVVTLADSLLVLTLAAALYPAFSAAAEPGRRAQLRSLVDRALRVMTALLAPVTALLVIGAEPLVRLVFGRGDFGADDVRLTAVAVVGYAFAATMIGIRSLASRAALALGDSRVTVWTGVAIMVTNVIGDLTLGIRYGVAGLAASTSLSLALGALLLVVVLARRHAAVDARALGVSVLRVGAAVGAASGVTVVVGLPDRFADQDASVAADLGALAATGGLLLAVYLLALVALRSPELRDLTQALRDQVRGLRRGRR